MASLDATMRIDLFKECNGAFCRTKRVHKVFKDMDAMEDFIWWEKFKAKEKCFKAEVYAIEVKYCEDSE